MNAGVEHPLATRLRRTTPIETNSRNLGGSRTLHTRRPLQNTGHYEIPIPKDAHGSVHELQLRNCAVHPAHQHDLWGELTMARDRISGNKPSWRLLR